MLKSFFDVAINDVLACVNWTQSPFISKQIEKKDKHTHFKEFTVLENGENTKQHQNLSQIFNVLSSLGVY